MELNEEQEQLVELAKRVPLADVSVAKRMLEALIVDPLWLSLQTAPLDDEEVTDDDRRAMAEAEAAFARGEITPHDEILKEFGLK